MAENLSIKALLVAPMLIGYARVSTQYQETAAQIAALKTVGCELIFQENASTPHFTRPCVPHVPALIQPVPIFVTPPRQ
jgi:hypothetical protein